MVEKIGCEPPPRRWKRGSRPASSPPHRPVTASGLRRHWDEDHNKLNAVAFSLQNGFTLLPDSYTYPGVNYWLTLDAMAPELIGEVVNGRLKPAEFRADLLPVLQTPGFRLRLRRVFAFVTSLTAVWIYLTVLVWNRPWWEAGCASCLFAFSWEIVYHSRWIAPDTILMQFGALTFLLVSVAWKTNSRWALYGAAISAGFACGSKYPGGLIVLPILTAVWLSKKPWRRAAVDSVVLFAIMQVAYLITTPGTLVQPLIFLESLRNSVAIYANGWFGYTVNSGPEHLCKMLYYFATQLFSTFTPVSVALFGFTGVGVWAVCKESWRDAVVLLVFPVCYMLYFSGQNVMVVRNYLIVTPFLFILSARGLAWLAGALRWPTARLGFAAAVAVLIVVNAIDQISAAESVAHRSNKEVFLQDFQRYAASHAGRVLAISPHLERELKNRGFWPKNLVAESAAGLRGPFDEYVSYYSETISPRESAWPTNQPDSFVAVFGPREVNLNYYTGWWGDDRIISITPALVREMGLVH